MIYDLSGMYQLLDKYAENDIDEEEHAFIPRLKWPDDYSITLKICNKGFWEELQERYDITFTEEDKRMPFTVGDLKKKISL